MPNFTYYGGTAIVVNEWGSIICFGYQQAHERADALMEQLWREDREQAEKDKQRQDDKRKYPLFFLKEGIV